ncbi:glutamine-fructose-6-phosphate transaminase [Neorickettsia helminthoeca str. Oregon]|uniref:Glutamine--fructose-6-phosphate aminotransferase [isomerizing] n=1 Tax=Neorickettsia helminthoeca str. Oregon TaxID=1286528 RepID=X5H415_9RICK|nr:glutamine--fructose-6-phosphate transaminase (isomerizing) [Neorickettsia helminthoeca]AHX11428.1 glutamine-fructose-6-phosphate transaminase [Neorickettsia helminthoeca str. Oregon]
MCGIVGVISSKDNVVPLVLNGLSCLQYRGYDSAGCIFLDGGKFTCTKVIGPVQGLIKDILNKNPFSKVGMGHTRWATHGQINLENAHPHYDSDVAIIHNGIVENATELRKILQEESLEFKTDTDTEVILKLIVRHSQDHRKIDVLQRVMGQIHGSFAIVVIFQNNPNEIFAMKRGISLIAASNGNISVVASDLSAVSFLSEERYCMEDNDIAVISPSDILFFNSGKKVIRKAFKSSFHNFMVAKRSSNKKQDFMLSEILEQPALIGRIARAAELQESDLKSVLKSAKNINIVACGSSFFAGCIARAWIEKYLDVRVNVEVASEFTWRDFMKDELFIFISQSGETADTLLVLKTVRNYSIGSYIISVVNVPESSIARLSDFHIYTNAGPELSVAATKSFTSQLATLLHLVAFTGKNKEWILDGLTKIEHDLQEVIDSLEFNIDTVVEQIYRSDRIFYVGKGLGYFVAVEGALKLKEISYIMAEGIQSGELKHGSIALIEKGFPVILLAPSSLSFAKVLSSIQEIYTRNGKLFIFTDKDGVKRLEHLDVEVVVLPDTSELTMPFVYTVAMQILAYRVAVKNGRNVDYPRNLAKSITVE